MNLTAGGRQTALSDFGAVEVRAPFLWTQTRIVSFTVSIPKHLGILRVSDSRRSESMNKKVWSIFCLIGAAVVVGMTVGFLDIAVSRHGQTPSLRRYDSIVIDASWNQTRDNLRRISKDCAQFSSLPAPPPLIHCSDSWWEYSFYFDPNDSSVRAKRFSPRNERPFPFRLIR